MDVKRGYKQTEVGVIPEDWSLEYIENLACINTGSRNTQDRVVDGQYPFFVRSQTVERINSYSFDGEAVLTAGDGVGTGKVFHYINGKCDVHQRVYRISDFGERVNGYFFYLYFSSRFYNRIMQMTAKSSVDSVRREMIARMLIPLPPTKAEQAAIAEALSDADALIESLEHLLTKKRHIKQGAMEALFCPKDDWRMEKLEDIADVIDPHPSHRAPPVVPNGIPFVGIGDLSEDGDLIGTKVRTVDPSIFKEHQTRYDLSDELIGLGRVASIGKVVKLKFTGAKYAISPTLGVIRGTKVRRDYLLHALKSKVIVDQFNKIMSGSTRSSVGMVVLRRLNISLPNEEAEQISIASILSDMDAEIAALEEKLAKARHIKQGMMQELLTGRVRLV